MKKIVFGGALLVLMLAATSTFAQHAAPVSSPNLESAPKGNTEASKSASKPGQVQVSPAQMHRQEATGNLGNAQAAGNASTTASSRSKTQAGGTAGKQATLAPASAIPSAGKTLSPASKPESER